MTKEKTKFYLNEKLVEANADETIWQVANRLGTEIPHLCYSDKPGYRADGNCRACMVEIEGERVLAASCIRKPTDSMKVKTSSEKAKKSRELVFELLLADQPKKEIAHDNNSDFWKWIDKVEVKESRFPKKTSCQADVSHPSMAVNLDACIQCNLCVRACREVQVNDVIGMAYRGENSKIVFDFDDPMGDSTCVACGECVQACPTGALMEKSLLNKDSTKREIYPDKVVDSVCPFCGVGCQTSVSIKGNDIVKVDGRQGPANRGKLCVKGRFGMDYVMSPERLTKPLIRLQKAKKYPEANLSFNDIHKTFREATWEEALQVAADGFLRILNKYGGDFLCGFGSAKGTNEEAYLFQKFIRQAFGTNNVDHCTRLCHASSVAALMEGIGSGAVSAPFTAADDSDCIMVIGARPEQNHPVAATYLKQAAKRGAKLLVFDPRKQNLNYDGTSVEYVGPLISSPSTPPEP